MKPAHVHLVEQVAACQTSHDIDKLLALFTEDILLEDVALGIVANGHAKVRELFESIYVSAPDYAMTLVSAVADEQRGGMEWVMSGTNLGAFAGLPASGKPFSVRAASAMRFAAGRISHWSDYWSLATFKEQIGLA